MATSIFPPEIIENSVEQHLADHSTRSQLIYISVLIMVLTALISLPLVHLDVSIQSGGIIRPIIEKTALRAPYSSWVQEVLVKDNQTVAAGQPLLVLGSEQLTQQQEFNSGRQQELQQLVYDLRQLVQLDPISPAITTLRSDVYTQSYQQFQQKLAEAEIKEKKTIKDFNRTQLLYDEKIISAKQYDELKLQKDLVESEYRLLWAGQTNQWQNSLQQYRTELAEWKSKAQQLAEEQEQYVIKAPQAGTVQNMQGIYPGGYLHANQDIAELSPDSTLIVECYVSPKDIGYLQTGTSAVFQVDAFNYNDWGTVEGKVISVAHDITFVDNQPVFKVRSALATNVLKLNNGYRGTLKKGMTVRTRFMLARRSLYQLLYDKVDDWLNPVNN